MAETKRLPRLSGWRRMWLAAIASSLGDGMVESAALPLLAAALTRNPVLISAVFFASRLPWLVLGLVSGAVVDRGDRRRIMVRADVARMVILGVLGLLVLAGAATLPMIFAAAFLSGVAQTFFDNASMAAIQALVPAEELERVNGQMFGAEMIMLQFIGPVAGSVLYGRAAWSPFLLDAVSFAISAALIFTLAASLGSRQQPPAAGRSIRAEVSVGLHWLWHHPVVRTLAVLVAILAFVAQAILAILVLFALRVLHLSTDGYGLLLGAAGVGSLAGNIIAPRISSRVGARRCLMASIVVSGGAYLGIYPTDAPVLVGVLLAANGFSIAVWNVVTVSLRQMIVPPHLTGRVNSVYRMLAWGGLSLGSLAGGFIGRAAGLRAPFLLGGLVVILLAPIAAVLLRRITPVGTQA
jgi:MFS family permease